MRARCGTREGTSKFNVLPATHHHESLVTRKLLFYICQMPGVDPEARRAALALLSQGMITIAEAVELAGVSRQLMHHWVRRAGIDWQRIRQARLAAWWRKELRHGSKLVETAKPRSGKPRKTR